ncbi:ABC transporter permease [Nonomuraea typhae]|uniref:ABC transporter permease n=1 Tax=Nonomuraea typhae TaxID=2603600 RepID=UPI0012FC895B|nr:ABC transporter permease [Nonomuraea typhae]
MSDDTGTVLRRAAAPPYPVEVRRRGQAELVVRRFLRHRAAVASLVLFAGVLLLAFAGGALWRYDYADITSAVSAPPSLEHPFGTDNLGHDTFAQVLRGTQRSIEIALLIAFLSGLAGTLWGAFSGYYRGITDSVMMRLADLVLTLPLLAVAAVLTRGTSGSWWFVALVIASLQWAYVSRVVRGVVLSLREKEYVEASRALGATDRWIIFRHLIPNALGPIIVNVTILVAAAILVETALSFLGLGVQPPDTSLGLLVSEADTAVSTRPWLFYFPGAFIVVIALTINFIGDGLRDAFDPTQRKVRS